MKVLIVEDTPELALWLSSALRKMKLEVENAYDGNEAAQRLLSHQYGLVLLDLNLPYRDGLSILQELRARKDDVPVIILTAKSDLSDRVKGLKLGADDYLPKPFDLEELEARIQALLRRVQVSSDKIINVGQLQFNQASRSFWLKDELIHFTPRETSLLEILMNRKDRIVTKELLLSEIFGNEEIESDAVEVLIYRLRKKLLAEYGLHIETVRGLGYVLKIQA